MGRSFFSVTTNSTENSICEGWVYEGEDRGEFELTLLVDISMCDKRRGYENPTPAAHLNNQVQLPAD